MAKKNGRNVRTNSEQLKSYVERIENLENDKRGLTVDIKEVGKEAKAAGFNVVAMS